MHPVIKFKKKTEKKGNGLRGGNEMQRTAIQGGCIVGDQITEFSI